MLGSLGYWGFHAHSGFLAKIVLGLGAPLIAAIVWGAFVSPKAAIPLSAPLWILVQCDGRAGGGAARTGLGSGPDCDREWCSDVPARLVKDETFGAGWVQDKQL